MAADSEDLWQDGQGWADSDPDSDDAILVESDSEDLREFKQKVIDDSLATVTNNNKMFKLTKDDEDRATIDPETAVQIDEQSYYAMKELKMDIELQNQFANKRIELLEKELEGMKALLCQSRDKYMQAKDEVFKEKIANNRLRALLRLETLSAQFFYLNNQN